MPNAPDPDTTALSADRPPPPPPPARRILIDPDGPVLVEGPVEVAMADGTVQRSDRFVTALCTCRRSAAYPWCDTSHRPREHP